MVGVKSWAYKSWKRHRLKNPSIYIVSQRYNSSWWLFDLCNTFLSLLQSILILGSDSTLTPCRLPALSLRSSFPCMFLISEPLELMGEQPGTLLSGASVCLPPLHAHQQQTWVVSSIGWISLTWFYKLVWVKQCVENYLSTAVTIPSVVMFCSHISVHNHTDLKRPYYAFGFVLSFSVFIILHIRSYISITIRSIKVRKKLLLKDMY